MAVRFRKYFKDCKPIPCGGKKSKQCPELPKEKPCGGWAIEYRELDGRWVSRIFSGIGKTEAQEFLGDAKSKIRRKMVGLPANTRTPTLSEYGKQYLELYTTAKENTKKQKQWAVGVLTTYLGDYRLDKLSPFIVERFRIDYKEKNKVGNSVINDCVFALSHILNMAIKGGLIDKNPCKDVKRLKVAQTRDRVLSSEEISLLLNKLHGKDRLMVLIGLFCGLRLNETLKLTWDNFDFDKGLLSLVACKTGKQVTVPLSDYLINELQTYKINHTGDRLFESQEVNSKMVVVYSAHFCGLFKSLGIHNFTYHNLRHCFASIQSEIGTGVVLTKEMLGHASLDMTLRYSHTGLDGKRKAINAMTDHVLNQGKNLTLALQGTA